MAFDVLIGNGEFAAETNVPISEPNACKMEISLGRRRVERSVHSRSKRAGKPFHHKFVVLAKQIGKLECYDATDKISTNIIYSLVCSFAER